MVGVRVMTQFGITALGLVFDDSRYRALIGIIEWIERRKAAKKRPDPSEERRENDN